jgi:hypothetical protein
MFLNLDNEIVICYRIVFRSCDTASPWSQFEVMLLRSDDEAALGYHHVVAD